MKLIICDKNEKLIEAIKQAGIKNSKRFEIEIVCGDVFKVKKKYPNAKICTASNPQFTAGGGLDKELKERYPEEWNNLKEFEGTNNLFPLITVNTELKAEEWRIQRSLVGVFAYLDKFDFILTGIGNGIGGLNQNVLIKCLVRIFSHSDLRRSNLSHSNLSHSNLSDSNLSDSNLSYSNLSDSNLSDSDLSDSDLSDSDLRRSNLSGAKMTNNTQKFMQKFKFNDKGLIVYKGIGHTSYPLNSNWKIKARSYLTEEVNFCKTNDCGCGVNFGTIEYIQENYPDSEIWECLIEFKDLVEVVIPYNTDGKARCSRLKLIKKLKKLKNEEK